MKGLLLSVFYFFIFLLFFVTCQIEEEYSEKFWYNLAKENLIRKISDFKENGIEIDQNVRPKNIILFIGDGMGITMTTISRIFKNQQESQKTKKNIFDQTQMFFESFPVSGLQKTHTLDSHIGVSDACAVALVSGQKVLSYTLGIKPTINKTNCEISENDKMKNLISIKALEAGMNVGIVTTTRITHATPGGMYAHTTSRFHESDADMEEDERKKCKDIASQILDYPANKFKVIFGGGRENFIPKESKDYVNKKKYGRRLDGKHIIEEWKMKDKENKYVIYTTDELKNLSICNLNKTSQILGIFSTSHMESYETRSKEAKLNEPTLEEMVEKAIQILSKDNDNGYFLMVEGGIIDIAEHLNKAYIAMSETVQMDQAVKKAVEVSTSIHQNPDILDCNENVKTKYFTNTQKTDTLVIVTADHSHAVTFHGYHSRRSPVLTTVNINFTGVTIWDGKNIPTILFTSGPGFDNNWHQDKTDSDYYTRVNLSTKAFENPNFIAPSSYKSESNFHGGSDVPVYASGPMSIMFTGHYDNTQIGYTIKYLLCINEDKEMNICDDV